MCGCTGQKMSNANGNNGSQQNAMNALGSFFGNNNAKQMRFSGANGNGMEVELARSEDQEVFENIAGSVMATTTKKCPAGYVYVVSQGNCWPADQIKRSSMNGNGNGMREFFSGANGMQQFFGKPMYRDNNPEIQIETPDLQL